MTRVPFDTSEVTTPERDGSTQDAVKSLVEVCRGLYVTTVMMLYSLYAPCVSPLHASQHTTPLLLHPYHMSHPLLVFFSLLCTTPPSPHHTLFCAPHPLICTSPSSSHHTPFSCTMPPTSHHAFFSTPHPLLHATPLSLHYTLFSALLPLLPPSQKHKEKLSKMTKKERRMYEKKLSGPDDDDAMKKDKIKEVSVRACLCLCVCV